MPNRTSDQKPAAEIDELPPALEQLCRWIEVLADAVERIGEELQWRNNQRRGENVFSPPPVTLRSMPADPTTDDWALNRVPAEKVTTIRDGVKQASPSLPDTSRSHVQMCREIAELRQIVAAIVLLMSDHYVADLSTEFDWLVAWASEEFDSDILRNSLPQEIVSDPESGPDTDHVIEAPPVPKRSEQQPTLFAGGAADAE